MLEDHPTLSCVVVGDFMEAMALIEIDGLPMKKWWIFPVRYVNVDQRVLVIKKYVAPSNKKSLKIGS